MHESLSRSTFDAVVEHLSAKEKHLSCRISPNGSFHHRSSQLSLREMSGQAPNAAVDAVAPYDRTHCTPITSPTAELPEQRMPVLHEVNSASADALKLRHSSDELDGYCSSYEGSLPDDSDGSSSELTSRTKSQPNLTATLQADGHHKPHRRRRHQRYRGRGSPIRNATRDEERQRLVSMSFEESGVMAKGVEGQVAPSADSATAAAALPLAASKAVPAAGGVARESSFRGIRTPYPKPIAATTSTKTSVAMISAALSVAHCSAEAAQRSNCSSPHAVPLGGVANMSDAMQLTMQTPLLAPDEGGGESAGLLRSSTASRLSQSSSNHSDAAEESTDGASGSTCFVELPSSTMPRPQHRSSPTSTSGLAGNAAKGSNNRNNSVVVGVESALRATPSSSTAAPPIAARARGASRAADRMTSSIVNADNESGARAAASDTLQGVANGPSAEHQSDKERRISAVDAVSPETADAAGVATLTSKNATVLLHDAAAATFVKCTQVPTGSSNRVDLSSSSSVGGHHFSVTEGSAFLKQSGSRREEAFYNMIRPYQEALVREAVRQAPHTVEHWNRYHAGTRCTGGQRGAASAVSSAHMNAANQSQRHTTSGCSSSDDDGNRVVADPADVAALCEARWEAYQQYEAEDMSSLSILASEQLPERSARREHQRGARGSGFVSLSHGNLSSSVLPPEVDKDLLALAARLWWTVRFRHFYRTSVPAYEVQRQAAEAAGLSPQSPSAGPPATAVTTSDSVGAVVTNSRCSTPTPQQCLFLSASPPSQESHHARSDSAEAARSPRLPMSPSMAEQGDAALRGESAAGGAVVAMIPCLSGNATPCMASSFAASLLDGVAGSASAAERQYAVQKHRALQLLAAFVPRYHGTRRLFVRDVLRCEIKGRAAAPLDEGQPPGEKQQIVVDADNDEDDDGNRSGDQKICRMIMLEYVCYRFRHPCVMDIKMGSRQYGLHPSPEKKQSKERKAKLSTSARYGIRLSGYRRWNAEERQYNFRSKLQCRCLSLNEVKSEVSAFLLNSREMERVFRRQLQRLRVAFSQQTVFRFYTSSLLFVYDAEDPLKTARVTMVDFAYTYESKELQQGGDPDADFDYDVGYLKAIDTLLSLLA
ncbi:hypothetical protein LSCM1_04834 [Leishmania martiniquensis]|uniref:Kinase n=1 Tax=Leishmania martiniquensis TaxID=1580590 RepID=A0A836KRU8_9TRYP|nr:hypothetical protein LSCM1_04834 [Leishmania martiniquensis]